MGTINEHAPDTDYKFEYTEARKLMGLKSTNLQELQYAVGMLYLNCPDGLSIHFLELIEEIQLRQDMLAFPALFNTK